MAPSRRAASGTRELIVSQEALHEGGSGKVSHTWGYSLGYGDKSCYDKPGNKEHGPVRERSMQMRSFCKHNQAGLERQCASGNTKSRRACAMN